MPLPRACGTSLVREIEWVWLWNQVQPLYIGTCTQHSSLLHCQPRWLFDPGLHANFHPDWWPVGHVSRLMGIDRMEDPFIHQKVRIGTFAKGTFSKDTPHTSGWPGKKCKKIKLKQSTQRNHTSWPWSTPILPQSSWTGMNMANRSN